MHGISSDITSGISYDIIWAVILRTDIRAYLLFDDHPEINIPIIIRLEGTNAKSASELLKNAEFNFIVANSLDHAAKLAVKATQGDNIWVFL